MIHLDAHLGSDIFDTIDIAIQTATAKKDQVQFEFNGVTVVVAWNSDRDLILRDWRRGMNGYLGKNPTVGPHPRLSLTMEEQANDARIEAELEAKRQDSYRESEKRAAAEKLILDGALADAGPIELSDADGWAKTIEANQDGYGGGVVRFAETWARLMQQRVAGGESVAECAKDCSRMADTEGITGAMYGFAVSILAKVWIYGEQLRRWHNIDTQIGTEGEAANESGGTLNPAMLNIK